MRAKAETGTAGEIVDIDSFYQFAQGLRRRLLRSAERLTLTSPNEETVFLAMALNGESKPFPVVYLQPIPWQAVPLAIQELMREQYYLILSDESTSVRIGIGKETINLQLQSDSTDLLAQRHGSFWAALGVRLQLVDRPNIPAVKGHWLINRTTDVSVKKLEEALFDNTNNKMKEGFFECILDLNTPAPATLEQLQTLGRFLNFEKGWAVVYDAAPASPPGA